MKRNRILASIATLSMAVTAPAVAKPGGGGEGQDRSSGRGDINAGGINETGSTMRELGRENSMGPDRASDRAIERANDNSVLKGETTITTRAGSNIRQDRETKATARAGAGVSASANTTITVTSGMTVADSTGATVGTVTGVSTRGNGSTGKIQVQLTDGRIITLKAKDLSLVNGVLTTSTVEGQAANRRVNSQGAAHANVNGLVHASPKSALAGAGVTTLTGLTTGLTVNNSAGATIGTVTEVLTNTSGAVVGVRVDLTGDAGIVFIPATTLSISGGVVTTTTTNL